MLQITARRIQPASDFACARGHLVAKLHAPAAAANGIEEIHRYGGDYGAAHGSYG
jgi:hypothetical protein